VGHKKPSFKQESSSKNLSWWKRVYLRTGWRGKTLWDWQALLFVPVTIVLIAALISQHQAIRQLEIESERAQQAQKIENQRAEAERELAEQRAQDEALQLYLDQMSNLLLERNLRESAKDSEVRTLARARTLTTLSTLDSARKERLLQFLYEAGLLQKENRVIDLNGGDLSGIDLHRNNLSGTGPYSIVSTSFGGVVAPENAANLSGAVLNDANLEGAMLSDTDLSDADLSDTDLSNAELSGADLSFTNLSNADLSNAYLAGADLAFSHLKGADLSKAYLTKEDVEGPISRDDPHFLRAHLRAVDLTGAVLIDANLSDANLSGAILTIADMRNADLTGAKLSGADLSEADMSGVEGVTKEELEAQAASLGGATMPNGQKLPREALPLESGSLEARREYVTDEYAFDPAFRFKVGNWFWAVSSSKMADVLLIEKTWPDRGFLTFASPLHVFDPSYPSERKEVPAPEKVDEWVSWFQRHPKLDTSKPVPVSVGGASGMRIDVTATSTPENYPRDDCERPCVFLYPSSGEFLLSSRNGAIPIYEETKERYIIVDVKDETVIINVSAPPDKFSEFLPSAQKVLDTVEWGSD
jgi:uncharacterized protein YjbI with pentapeptide repeats